MAGFPGFLDMVPTFLPYYLHLSWLPWLFFLGNPHNFPSFIYTHLHRFSFSSSQFHEACSNGVSEVIYEADPAKPRSQFPRFLAHDGDQACGEALIGELCKGFELLMDGERGVITFESLRRNAAAVLGLGDLTDDDIRRMISEGDSDRDGAMDQMEFCVLMFRLSSELMEASRWLVAEAILDEHVRSTRRR